MGPLAFYESNNADNVMLTSDLLLGSQSPAPELKRSTNQVATSSAKANIKVAVTMKTLV